MEHCGFEDQSFSSWRIQLTRISRRPEVHLLLRIPPAYLVPARPTAFIYFYPSSGSPPYAAMIFFVVPTLCFLSATPPSPHPPPSRPPMGLTNSSAHR